MGADTNVCILVCKDGYRVKAIQSLPNLFSDIDNKIDPYMVWDNFGCTNVIKLKSSAKRKARKIQYNIIKNKGILDSLIYVIDDLKDQNFPDPKSFYPEPKDEFLFTWM